jgi:hypothetical protein
MKNKIFVVLVPVALLWVVGLAGLSLYFNFEDVKRGIEGLKQANIEQTKQISELSFLNEKLKNGKFFRDEALGIEMVFPTDYEEIDLNGNRAMEFGPKEKLPFAPLDLSPEQLDKIEPSYIYKVEFATSTSAEDVTACKGCGPAMNAEIEYINGLKVVSWFEGGDPGSYIMAVVGGKKNYIFSDWYSADYSNEENPDFNYFREIIKTIKLIK